jgi:hypothetical protein
MRQQLITWLIDEIAPEIRKNRDPEGTILKFANEKNLAPALVQSLGQLFNTAKTLAFMEKSANRGASFPLLDVDKMVEKYTAVPHTKSASKNLMAATESAYDHFGFDTPSKSLAACFKDVPGLKIEDEQVYSEEPVKSASSDTRQALRSESETRHLIDTLTQAKADFEQDARELLMKSAQQIKQAGLSFEKIEQDALWVHGDIIKPATALLASYCSAEHIKVARARDAGENRLVRDNLDLIKNLELVSDCLFKIAATDEMMAATRKLPDSANPVDPAKGYKYERSPDPEERVRPLDLHQPPDKPHKSPKADRPESRSTGRSGGQKSAPAAEDKGYFAHVGGALNAAAAPLTNIPTFQKKFKEMLGHGRNSDQQHVDTSFEDAKHLAVLQNLLTTDDVLSEADPEAVVNMYNTVRRAAPSLAGDTNVMRVALRSMIQHDGVSPFDLKGFLDTEQAGQKNELNRRMLNDMDYGNGSVESKPAKPQ